MRLAVWQGVPAGADAEAGLAALAEVARRAADGGAHLLLTPEMALTGYAIGAEAVARLAQPRGVYHARVAEIARASGLAIAFGYPERTEAGVRNAAALVTRDGETLLDYAKTHLWGEIDRAQFVAGDRLSPVVDFAGWKVAFAICFDIEFPEVARALALAGAEVLLVPTACAEPFRFVPEMMIPIRAAENGVYLAYANYAGAEAARVYCGCSCLAGPDGTLLAQAGTGQDLLIARLDKGAMAAARRALPYLAGRRSDLYRTLAV